MKKIKKLALRSETIARLSGRELRNVLGGVITGDTNNPTVTDEMGNCCTDPTRVLGCSF